MLIIVRKKSVFFPSIWFHFALLRSLFIFAMFSRICAKTEKVEKKKVFTHRNREKVYERKKSSFIWIDKLEQLSIQVDKSWWHSFRFIVFVSQWRIKEPVKKQ